MIDHAQWRDLQLNSFNKASDSSILLQEKVMLDWVTKYPNIVWKWAGNNTKFKTICQSLITVSDADYRGVIVFGQALNQLTTSQLIKKVQSLIATVDYAYVGINRYEVVQHDLELELPDSIESSLDLIMSMCHPDFVRLYQFSQVDGNHLVAAHPMDCYGLCKQ
jgi:hypothetical protein